MGNCERLAITAFIWCFWCFIHSILNYRSAVAASWLRLIPDGYYRLFYNLFAIASLAAVASLTHRHGESSVFEWSGEVYYFRIVLWVIALFIGYLSFRKFSFIELLGLSAILRQEPASDPGLVTTGIYGIVRHPQFLAALIIVWAREIRDTDFVINAILSFYILLGSKIEEHRLIKRFGRNYINYMEQVPGFLPKRRG